jgi:hypothetical protein
MRSPWVALGLLGVTACADNVAERQEAALASAADAVPAVLVVAELLQHSRATPDPEATVSGARHAGACGCPCISALGTDDSYVQELDYEEPSCVPESDLLPARMGGHVWLDYDRGDVSITRAEAWLASRALPDERSPVDADLAGVFEGRQDLWEATVTGEATAGARFTAFTDLFIDLGRDVRFDGAVAGGRMVDLALPRRGEDAPCPLPVDGRYEQDGAVVTWVQDRMVVDVDGEVRDVDACELLAFP